MTRNPRHFGQAIKFIRAHPDAGTSELQRRFKIGYQQAIRLLNAVTAHQGDPK